jgi:hypothetical protein
MTARDVTLAGYILIVLAGGAWEAVSIRRGSLTLGQILEWLAQRRAVQMALLLGWAWLGWHLFARGTATFLTR